MKSPLVGIALAAYKPNIDYFEEQLSSIAAQTYPNWFCRVGFDSSLSDIRDEEKLARFFNDPRFDFRQNTGQPGASENFNSTAVWCLERNPDYIAFSDQDDVWSADKTERLVRALESKPPLSIVHCDMHILMKEGDSFRTLNETAWKKERRGIHNVSPLDFMIRNIAAGAGMILDSNLVRKYPLIPNDAFAHDHWYALVASYYGGVFPLDLPLYSYRIHGANIAGLSEYQGFFANSKSSEKHGFVNKCMFNFNSSRMRCLRAAEANLPVTAAQKSVTTFVPDFGLGYLLIALQNLKSDKATARAAISRALGKIFRILKPSFKTYAPA